jgi:hypothetical protein
LERRKERITNSLERIRNPMLGKRKERTHENVGKAHKKRVEKEKKLPGNLKEQGA